MCVRVLCGAVGQGDGVRREPWVLEVPVSVCVAARRGCSKFRSVSVWREPWVLKVPVNVCLRDECEHHLPIELNHAVDCALFEMRT